MILLSLPLNGQNLNPEDTIQIGEVVISMKKINLSPPGFKRINIDSTSLKEFSHRNLAELLSEFPMIFIKSYGLGGTATPSFRGTAAGHTQIAWNNININHPMLGQSDLSLIPAGLIDDIEVYYGGASMALSSGGIGGAINLVTRPEWKKGTAIVINPGLGSFGRFSGLFKVKSGGPHFESVTKVFLQSSENDFPYLNTEISSVPVWETRRNSQVSQQGLIQELYYRKSKNIASAKIWYQAAKRNLPSSILSQQSGSKEKQFDESFRALLNYTVLGGKTNYYFTGAFLLSRLNYTNNLASINSHNLSELLTLKFGTERYIGENTKLNLNFDEELSLIKSNNYSHKETRNIATLTASLERNMGDRFGAMILLRGIFNNHSFLIPDFSSGIQFRLMEQKEYFLKVNISRNSKIPTLNDLFWVPGGNPELKNEFAYIYELSYEMKQHILSGLAIRYDMSVFRNSIKDMIQWHPGEYSYWTADNIKYVNSMGFESSLSLEYTHDSFKSVFTTGYSYTKASEAGNTNQNSMAPGKQLMYIPENQANLSIRMNYRNYYSSWIVNLTGIRYITVDNSRYLPGYILNNIITGAKINFKGNLLDLNFTIDNLFNVSYQTIAFYPQPGRSYSIKLLLQINR
jgi:iron complex outermembrane receptor protein